MSKSPEEYFQELDFNLPGNAPSSGVTEAEQAFMRKYMGIESPGAVPDNIAKVGEAPAPAAAGKPAPVPADAHAEMSEERKLEEIMRGEQELQMVGFYLGGQEFTVPTITVQEVIRYTTPSKLPMAPAHVAGVVNLRGKVTPLLMLRDMLEVSHPRQGEDKFVIVCRRMGLQIGLIIERIHTMYRVHQKDIDWGIENHLGINVDFVSGLLKVNDLLVGIVSVDRIIDYVLNDTSKPDGI